MRRPGADPDDFRAFVAASAGQLYRSACLLAGGDTHLAEDLVQEAFGRVYQRWSKVVHLDNPVGYAQTTLVNTFISTRRKRSNHERPGLEAVDAAAPDTDPTLRLSLLAALRQLTPKDRAVLVLRYWEDRSVEETAAALNLSPSAVRSRCGRALARVRDILGADFAVLAHS
ncbi:SigE family RNA polymerase sigma factor [Catenulispora yoronensis]|uniref:SigE family RNA polymerase sigma factor n=1 Tax=Catenulispora yoronensis TaxID=450799 RepID=A0ABP5G6N0_9ACTN